jgi:hypothetical protein
VITDGNLVTEADGTSRDISTTGMFVVTEAPLAPESELEIVMLLPGREAFTEDEYRAKARIVRKTEEGVGLELLEPSPDLVAALDNIA